MPNQLEYKGFYTDIEIDFEGHLLHGQIDNIRDLVTFESDTIDGIVQEFHSAVDDYFEFCKNVGKEPEVSTESRC